MLIERTSMQPRLLQTCRTDSEDRHDRDNLSVNFIVAGVARFVKADCNVCQTGLAVRSVAEAVPAPISRLSGPWAEIILLAR